MTKQEAIKTNNIDTMREYCNQTCPVKNFNLMCPKCKLTKAAQDIYRRMTDKKESL